MLLILLFAFMTPFGTLAQTIQLTGLVTDAANEPIIGASVVEKGTTNIQVEYRHETAVLVGHVVGRHITRPAAVPFCRA